MLSEAIEKGSENMQVYVTYAQIVQMKDHENGQAEALKILEKATAIDPLEASGSGTFETVQEVDLREHHAEVGSESRHG